MDVWGRLRTCDDVWWRLRTFEDVWGRLSTFDAVWRHSRSFWSHFEVIFEVSLRSCLRSFWGPPWRSFWRSFWGHFGAILTTCLMHFHWNFHQFGAWYLRRVWRHFWWFWRHFYVHFPNLILALNCYWIFMNFNTFDTPNITFLLQFYSKSQGFASCE